MLEGFSYSPQGSGDPRTVSRSCSLAVRAAANSVVPPLEQIQDLIDFFRLHKEVFSFKMCIFLDGFLIHSTIKLIFFLRAKYSL